MILIRHFPASAAIISVHVKSFHQSCPSSSTMASRLLSRYAHLLCRASSQAPGSAVASVSRLPMTVTPPVEVQRTEGWPQISKRFMHEKSSLATDDAVWDQTSFSKVNDLMKKATVPEDVLQAWVEHGGDANMAAISLVKWTQLVRKTKGDFKMDSRINEMLDTISAQVSKVWNYSLVSTLSSLWIIKIPRNDSRLLSIEQEVLWRVRKLTCKQLAFLVTSAADRKDQQVALILSTALKHLELRTTEIIDTKTVTDLFVKPHHLSPSLKQKVEDKALELAESFSAEEIRRILLSLGIQSRRNVPLLRALSYHLIQKPSSDFTPPLILDLAFAFGKLNFHHTQLFQRMVSELMPRVPQLRPSEVTRFAKSLTFLKWLNIPMYEALTEHFITNRAQYRSTEFCNLLMAFARLYFLPSNKDQFFTELHSLLDKSISDLHPLLRTDMVWSLCVLQQANPSYITPILEPQYVAKVLENDKSGAENYRLKLLHIATTLSLEHPGSSDLEPPSSLLTSSVLPTVSPMQSSLRESLQSLVGERTEALHTGVQTPYGWNIDGELLIDCDNKPINWPSGDDQSLPAGARRIAFIAWEFPNFGVKSKDLLGRFVMMRRHLQLSGYTLVEIPYYEFLELKTAWQKLAYLKDKMGKAVAEDMAK